jgi:membrane protein YdbS with pleckstrin-like domain
MAIGYAQLVSPMLWLWIFGSAVEAVAFDLILQRWWTPLRIPVLALSLWGLMWMLGLMASYRVRPHLLDGEVLRLRAGARTEVVVPLAAIERVTGTEADAPGLRSVKLLDDHLAVTATGRTNLRLELADGTTLRTPLGEVSPTRLGTWVDEPREVTGALRRLLAAPSP